MNKKSENTKEVERLLIARQTNLGEYPRGLASELAREYGLSRSRISKIALAINIQSSKFKIKDEALNETSTPHN